MTDEGARTKRNISKILIPLDPVYTSDGGISFKNSRVISLSFEEFPQLGKMYDASYNNKQIKVQRVLINNIWVQNKYFTYPLILKEDTCWLAGAGTGYKMENCCDFSGIIMSDCRIDSKLALEYFPEDKLMKTRKALLASLGIEDPTATPDLPSTVGETPTKEPELPGETSEDNPLVKPEDDNKKDDNKKDDKLMQFFKSYIGIAIGLGVFILVVVVILVLRNKNNTTV